MSPELRDSSASNGDGVGESKDNNDDGRSSCSEENGNIESDDDSEMWFIFDDLQLVLDARCDTGGLSVEIFELRYHFPALLIFSDFGPRRKIDEFIAGVYQ